MPDHEELDAVREAFVTAYQQLHMAWRVPFPPNITEMMARKKMALIVLESYQSLYDECEKALREEDDDAS